MLDTFAEIGVVVLVATLFGALALRLGQSLVLAYVVAGILLGPGLGMISSGSAVPFLSELGIALLLFLVGIEMDVRRLKNIGTASVILGVGQVVFTFALGLLLARLLGFGWLSSSYLSFALALSSTMIVVKLLSDKSELETLHGRLVVGMLVVQDVIAIFGLAFLANITRPSLDAASASLLSGLVLFGSAYAAGKFVLPGVFRLVARSSEMVFFSALSWCFLLALFSRALGYNIAVGAFLAGISLAPLSYSLEIFSRVKSLRDFFVTIFFVVLGTQLGVGSLGQVWFPALLFSLFVLVGNPLIVMVVMSVMGYHPRTSFLASVAIAQISEFSLIIMALGLQLGHVDALLVSTVTLVAIVTIVASSYLIKYDSQLYQLLSPWLSAFQRLGTQEDSRLLPSSAASPEVVLCGHNRIGYGILKTLKRMRKRVLVIDYNPEVIQQMRSQKIPCLYGDIGDIEIIRRMNLKRVRILISTVPEVRENLLLIQKMREARGRGIIIVTANHIDHALELYRAGADYVVLPHFLGGEHVSLLLERFYSRKKMLRTRHEHILELKHRKEIGHAYPVQDR